MASWKHIAGPALARARSRLPETSSDESRVLEVKSGPPTPCLCIKWPRAQARGQPVVRYEVLIEVDLVGAHVVQVRPTDDDAGSDGKASASKQRKGKDKHPKRDGSAKSVKAKQLYENLDEPNAPADELGASSLLAGTSLSARGAWTVVEGSGLPCADAFAEACSILGL